MTGATAPRVGLLHTSPAIVADVVDIARERVPGAEFENFVDEHLIKALPADGSNPAETRRSLDHVLGYLDGLGLAAIQVTCTSLSPLVDAVSPRLRTATFAFDHAFADAVRETGCRSPLLLVTVATSVDASVAALAPLPVAHLYVPEAFEARMRGDLDRQNDLLVEAVSSRPETDAVLLAQASLLPAVPELRKRLGIPVLHGAESAFHHLRRILQ